eukprot:TRINITY_DN4580_c2_g1_i1.p1 TRINITY_DN4580_c2_g1~~TRINITY_DN4580_c2_g1_i1.p1  ORF type:complete len:400 (+),score=10.72 TRINITY_DN4580_c2_g1_i1:104-1201(+)
MVHYIGILLYLGLNKKPMQYSHQKKYVFYSSPFLKAHVGVAKCKIIKQIFHLANNEEHKDSHCFFKVRSFMKLLANRFRKFYMPTQQLSVDESMISFKGRARFQVYIPSKPTKWGIKLHCLNESTTGYCLSYALNPGKTKRKCPNDIDSLVLKLARPYIRKHYASYMDSYYSSVSLFEQLYFCNTGAIGTVRKNRKYLPIDFVKDKNTRLVDYTSNGIMVLTKWKDKKPMLCLSTVAGPDIVRVNLHDKEKAIPNCIVNYSKYMRGVDIMDQAIQTYRFPHRSEKRWKRVFYHILEIAAYIIWKHHKGNTFDYLSFREQLVKELLQQEQVAHEESKEEVKMSHALAPRNNTSPIHDLLYNDKRKR